MPNYCVNKESQSNGDHEVHKMSCNYLPAPYNQKDLGYHPDCYSAVREAKRTYPQSNGCIHCCTPCHTG